MRLPASREGRARFLNRYGAFAAAIGSRPSTRLDRTAPSTNHHKEFPMSHTPHDPQRHTRLHRPTMAAADRWAVLVLALVAQVLVVLDISVVNTAMPAIGQDLHLASSDLQWMVTAYLLLSGGGLLLGGRIADLFPRRRVFMTGMTLFTAASLFSGFAACAGELIAGRAPPGAGAALMTPAALALIMTTYTGAQRARGLALWGAIGGLGIAAGVAVGGALTTWAGWQAIFWVNVPVGVVALVVGRPPPAPRAHAEPGSASPSFDVARRRHRRHRPGHPDVRPRRHRVPRLGLGPDAHRARGRRRAAAPRSCCGAPRRAPPGAPAHLVDHVAGVRSTAVMLGITGLLMGTVFLTSNFVQTALGYSALSAGLAFLPLAAALVVGTHLASHVARAPVRPRDRRHRAVVVAGGGSLLLSRADADCDYVSRPAARAARRRARGRHGVRRGVRHGDERHPDQHAGMASGFLMTGHEIGAALGVAVLSAVATAAGALTTSDGAAAAFEQGFVAAARSSPRVRRLRAAPDARHARRVGEPAPPALSSSGGHKPIEGASDVKGTGHRGRTGHVPWPRPPAQRVLRQQLLLHRCPLAARPAVPAV